MKTAAGLLVCAIAICVAVSGPRSACAAGKTAEQEIMASFEAFKQALAKGDWNKAAERLSPYTMEFFRNCRTVALAPDSTNINSLSQMEVLIGYQAYFLNDRTNLQNMSAADMFGWTVEDGAIPIAGLANVDLHNVQVSGVRATAAIKRGAAVTTNVVLSFSLQFGKKWMLELGELLLKAEPELEAARAEQEMSKAEVAVLAIEEKYSQPIPELRELLLSPEVRKKIAALKEASSAEVYNSVISELSAGRQRDAEDLLEVFTGIHTNDQRLVFAQAVCSRSRFNKTKSGGLFRRVLDMDHRTIEGKCARLVLNLEERVYIDDSFTGLRVLSEKQPVNPLIPWVLGVECRENFKITGKTDRSLEGDRAYKRVLELFDAGPVMVHQTYGNILDELGRYAEALPHRRIAVQQEPKSWSYEGLGNTLTSLGRYAEADQAFGSSIKLAPDDASVWAEWGNSRRKAKAYDDALQKYSESDRLEPGIGYTLCGMGLALHDKGDFVGAAEKYQEAADLGYVWGFQNLGYLYSDKSNPARDDVKAAKCHEAAAQLGLPDALESLADVYYFGRKGVAKDWGKALKLYEQAVQVSDQMDAYIYYRLGHHYRDGEAVGRDMAKAVAYYRKAVAGGDARAANDLAWLYATDDRHDLVTHVEAMECVKKLSLKDWMQLDTIAAVHARNGDFALAAETQRQALELAKARKVPKKETAGAEERLELYLAGKPYTEKPSPATNATGVVPGSAGTQPPAADKQDPTLRQQKKEDIDDLL